MLVRYTSSTISIFFKIFLKYPAQSSGDTFEISEMIISCRTPVSPNLNLDLITFFIFENEFLIGFII
jgi:hypothetical protein